MKIILVIFFTATFLISTAQAETPKQPDQAQIIKIMSAQEEAWNRGDLEGFMAAYWHSPELVFVGKSGIKQGWQTTLDNYKKSYPDKSAMGQLKFNILKVEIQQTTAFVLGRWNLQRENDNPKGYFTLYWKKIDGEWKIVIDHSS